MATRDPSVPVTGYPPPQPPHNNPNRHPYPNPFLNPSYAYTYPQTDPSAARRRLYVSLLALFIILGSILFITWVILRPRLPQFELDSLSVSNFNVSTSSQTLTGIWTIGFSAYNPNKKLSISYHEAKVFIFYKSELISWTRVAPFSQGTKTRSVVNATVSTLKSYVENWVVRDVNGDRDLSTVRFNVKVSSFAGFRTGGWRMRRRLIRVSCENVSVGFSSNGSSGKLVGGLRECFVGL